MACRRFEPGIAKNILQPEKREVMFEKSLMPLFGAFGWLSIMLLLRVVLQAKVRFF